MYLVTGSTGNVGSELVKVLHAQGRDVRALVRGTGRAVGFPAGVEVAVGDLDDPESIDAAVRGVDGVFHMQAGLGNAQTETMIRAMRSAGVGKMVLLSSVGARLMPLTIIGGALASREEVLRQSGLDVTYLRVSSLMSNAYAWADGIRKDGRVTDASGGLTVPVDPRDIARVAALTLTEYGHAGHGYILNGPEALTAREEVAILAEVLGRTIEFVDVTPEQFAAASIARGMPAHFAKAVQNLNEDVFRFSRTSVIAQDVENLLGILPASFRDWCQRHSDAFK